MMTARLLALSALIMVLASACGSGVSASTSTTGSAAGPADFKDPSNLLITRQDIARQANAPAAAIMRWWQDLQFQDINAAARSYAPTLKIKRMANEVHALSSFLASSKPQIEESDITGKSARVLSVIQWVAFKRKGTNVVELPVAFRLVKRGRMWKLTNDDLLAYRLQLQKAGG
jgi:hypothetical protein